MKSAPLPPASPSEPAGTQSVDIIGARRTSSSGSHDGKRGFLTGLAEDVIVLVAKQSQMQEQLRDLHGAVAELRTEVVMGFRDLEQSQDARAWRSQGTPFVSPRESRGNLQPPAGSLMTSERGNLQAPAGSLMTSESQPDGSRSPSVVLTVEPTMRSAGTKAAMTRSFTTALAGERWPATVEPRETFGQTVVTDGDMEYVSELMNAEIDNNFKSLLNWTSSGRHSERHADLQQGATRSALSTGREGAQAGRGCSYCSALRTRFLLEPTASTRVFLDVLSLLVLLYEMTMTPFALAWDLRFEGFLKAMAFFTLAFWASDIGFRFRTGFYLHGVLIMDPEAIAKKYLRSVFLFDLLLVLSDLSSIVLNTLSDNADLTASVKVLRFAKAARALRILSVLRMMHVSEYIQRIVDRSGRQSGTLNPFVELCQLLFAILWIGHIMSCGWFAVGRLESDTGLSWLETPVTFHKHEEFTVRESTMLYQYTTSFHFALSQMTPGSMQIVPHNSPERIYNIACLIFGLLFFSSLVSSVSSKMTHMKLARSERTKKLSELQSFLRRSVRNPALSVQVQKQATEMMLVKKPISVNDVPALQLLSRSLRLELQFELCKDSILRHPFLRLMAATDHSSARELCGSAATFTQLVKGDQLFIAGQKAAHAYMLKAGDLVYIQEPRSSMVPEQTEARAERGQMISEAALWTRWSHVGKAEAVEASEVLQLDAKGFASLLCSHQSMRIFAIIYAETFHERLVACAPPATAWPTDLEVPFTDFAEIVVAMKPELRMFVGIVASRILRGSGQLRKDGVAKLKDEVVSGSSTLIVTDTGEVERVVILTALKLSNSTGAVLVQLGKWEDGTPHLPSCKYPGSKQLEGETPNQTIERLLAVELPCVRQSVLLQGSETTTEVQNSAQFQLRTKYIRTMYYADFLEHDFEDLQSESEFSGRWSSLTPGGERVESPISSEPMLLRGSQEETQAIYAWVSPAEFEFLSTKEGKTALEAWFSCLALDKVCKVLL